jgi:hypothetical protein
VDDAKMTELFQKHLTSVQEWLGSQPNVSVLYVHYSEMLADPLPQIDTINKFLGGDLDIEKMTDVIDPNLYRNRREQIKQQNAAAG